ncbi:hypothetical protein PISMIDRAFT_17597 [Pisolithus microcarpus 441]|uniref:Uncharacterized protein n=1 Tax=Pisolithus microcarpus 441 TaxID=765257 RepID=A0A0C9YV36_9AGAM|nr:hypothetical protein PISMIDRAFT_17597 [Pisolithus microcarpus 441]
MAKPHLWSSSEGLTNENHEEEYLNLFWSKVITLNNGRKMNWATALQQLCAGVITLEDIADKGGHDQSVTSNVPSDAHTQDTQQADSEDDEQAVEDAVQHTHAAETHISDTCDHPPATVPHTVTHILDTVTHSSDEGIDMDGQDIDDQGAPDTDIGDDSDNGHGECGDIQHGDSEAEAPDSDWSANDRCHHKAEQCCKEILGGNYDINSHPATPPCQTSSSSSESDGDNCTTEVHSQTEGRHA